MYRKVAVHSCHGSGKSFLAASITCAWLGMHPPGEAFVVTTAPTNEQVRGVLWREIGKAFRRNKAILPGRVNQRDWLIDNELIAFGRKPSDTDPTAFQGIHARYVLVILDEACGIPISLWRAATSLASNDDSRMLAIGNPDDPESYFAEVCKPGSSWHAIHVGYDHTPNFTGEKVPEVVRTNLIGPRYVEDLVEEDGADGPVYTSKVLGLFPENASDGVIKTGSIARCRIPREELVAEDLLPIELGVDVGAGGDESIIYERRGMKAGRIWRDHSRDSDKTVAKIIEAIHISGATRVKVDMIGWGYGIVGHLRQLGRDGYHDAKIIPVDVRKESSKPKRFARLRDQMWWEIGRELSATLGWDLSEVPNSTISQLLSVKYALDVAGRVKIEAKDETRERIGRSPDEADALLLAFFKGGGQGAAFSELWRNEVANMTDEPVSPEVRAARRILRRGLLGDAVRGAGVSRQTSSCEHRWRGGCCVFCGTPKTEPTDEGA